MRSAAALPLFAFAEASLNCQWECDQKFGSGFIGYVQGTAPFCGADCNDCGNDMCGPMATDFNDGGHECLTGTKQCCCRKQLSEAANAVEDPVEVAEDAHQMQGDLNFDQNIEVASGECTCCNGCMWLVSIGYCLVHDATEGCSSQNSLAASNSSLSSHDLNLDQTLRVDSGCCTCCNGCEWLWNPAYCAIRGNHNCGCGSAALMGSHAALSGQYEGSIASILEMKLNFTGNGTMVFGQKVKVAAAEIQCLVENIAETDSLVTFPEIGKKGDCMGDALRGQYKDLDVSKFAIAKNADMTLTFLSAGRPHVKLVKSTVVMV